MSACSFKLIELYADKGCLELRHQLTGAAVCGKVLMVFEHAICLTAPFGLVTVLTATRGLQPYSLVLAHKSELSQQGCAANQQVLLLESMICFNTFNVILTKAMAIDLSIRNIFLGDKVASNYKCYLPLFIGLLNTDKDGGCLDALVLEKKRVFSSSA